MKIGLAGVGIILLALIGWMIGAILEHRGGAPQFIGAMIGAMLALAILVLGEALKSE